MFICHWRRSGVFIVKFEHIPYLGLVLLLLFLQVNAGWLCVYINKLLCDLVIRKI